MMESNPQLNHSDLEQEKHYIREVGFTFEPKLQKVEDSYKGEYYRLKNSIQDKINEYIAENKIELNTRGGFFEINLLDTNYEDWCDEYICEKSSEKKEALIEYIYGLINDKQNDLENLERKKKQLVKYYQKCNKRIQSNLKRMNRTYGNRLDFVINTKEDILEELALLFDRIERIERNIESMTSDSMDRISECNENVCGLYSELSELYENIVSEIQIDIEMLEEDLGIEFDVKGKFKELMERHKKK